jgi:poly-beta-1,6-N-acetyl-D-glucosamine N-deacetylase
MIKNDMMLIASLPNICKERSHNLNKKIFLKLVASFLVFIIFIYALMNDKVKHSGGYHYNNHAAVLEYHHIDPVASEYTITPEAFREQMRALQANHYHVIPMPDFIEFLKGRKAVPPDAVVITFDDGYESFYKYAYPILKELDMTATNFLIVNDLETNPGIAFLAWNQIEEMDKQGFSFYSHSFNSHDTATGANGKQVGILTDPIYLEEKKRIETPDEYAQRIKADLSTADQIIQNKLGPQDNLLCFPHGRYNQNLITLANEVGIQYFFTGTDGLNTPGTKLIKRINAGLPYVTADKLIQKLDDEITVLGTTKIFIKNLITSWRNSDGY